MTKVEKKVTAATAAATAKKNDTTKEIKTFAEIKNLMEVPEEKVSKKVPVGNAVILSMLFLSGSQQANPLEKKLAEVFINELTKLPEVTEAIASLEKQGYIKDGVITAFGAKLVLTGTSPTPNFQMLFANPNAAFRGLFESWTALKTVHGVEQNGIKPGKSDELCKNMLNVSNEIYDSLVLGGYIKD